MKVDITIIIVSFNTCDLLRKCLSSIYRTKQDLTIEIVVVDNNSMDSSAEMVSDEFPECCLIRNKNNPGFARANNQGLEKATGNYIFLLNPDTELFPKTLQTLIEFMDSHPEAGAAGPRTFLDRNKQFEVCSLKLLTPSRAIAAFTRIPFPGRRKTLAQVWDIDHKVWTGTEPVQVEGIGGAAFFIRKNLLDSFNGLDEQFFMGYEDTDLSKQLALAGYSINILPDCSYLHLFGQSKRKPEAPQKVTYAWQHAPARYLAKYHGSLYPIMLRLIRLADAAYRRTHKKWFPNSPYVRAVNGIKITWPDSNDSEYLFELSNDLVFFDKFAAHPQKPEILIPGKILSRLPMGRWHWRVFKGPDRSIEHSNGTFTSTP